MPHEGRLWDRVNRTGFGLAAGYLVLVVAVFALTAATTSPNKFGLDWIPLLLLTLPWSALVQRLSVPGVSWTETVALVAFLAGIVVNTAAMYIVGSKVQGMWSEFINWHGNRDY
jgi:hypothetical protein